MDATPMTYFTCTLGEAVKWRAAEGKGQRSFDTVLDVIDEQAEEFPDSPAIGFADFNSKPGTRDTVPDQATYSDLRRLSVSAATQLSALLMSPPLEHSSRPPTVGLICKTGLDFILTYLGLLRLGCTVFLLAPQLDLRAIKHLCQESGATRVFIHPSNQISSEQLGPEIIALRIPYYFSRRPDARTMPIDERHRSKDSLDIAHFFHTSGTSSGLPKPVAQTHWGAVGALPRLPHDDDRPATFSTTPLYHGGLADCFRAWTSGAMIWLFPESAMPITGGNVLKAVEYARSVGDVRIGYFSSVPYVLQMLVEEEKGTDLLQSMDLVGFGGAALPKSIGDRLVEKRVRLISRMGSAECGFLMSSYRDFATDQAWQFLRPVDDESLLSFEPRDDGLAELVVKPAWPLREKTNRNDGSYATADLFEQHATIPNAWRYHSRADAQIALDNGKKFDPSPIEDAILASTTVLEDVLVFGAGRSYPGAILFAKTSGRGADELIDEVWSGVEAVNTESPYYARLSKTMLVLIQRTPDEPPLEKSSKGTVMRGKAEKRYEEVIDRLYHPTSSTKNTAVTQDQLPASISRIFTQVIGRALDPGTDLYQQGVDSIACTQLRKSIERELMPDDVSLPLNVIYDNGSIDGLIRYLRGRLSGDHAGGEENYDEKELESMSELAERYGHFQVPSRGALARGKEVIVLTGATGALGAHILHELLSEEPVDKVYCLVRAKDQTAARERVSRSLSQRALPDMHEGRSESAKNVPEVVCVPFNPASDGLGLSVEHQNELKQDATIFIHAAWPVNFTLRLSSFETQIAATRDLINLSLATGARFLFVSSTAAVTQQQQQEIPESISHDPRDASPLGYSRSKWVAERICASAYDSGSPTVSVVRVGQLCGNAAGVWNASEAWPLMLSTARLTGCLPDFGDLPLDWLPVDLAARGVLDIALKGSMVRSGGEGDVEGRRMPVYHVLNPHKTPTWRQMIQWISESKQGPTFDTVSPAGWVARLETSLAEDGVEHPSKALLHLWKERYASESANGKPDEGPTVDSPTFSVARAQESSSVLRNLRPLDRTAVEKMWTWIQDTL